MATTYACPQCVLIGNDAKLQYRHIPLTAGDNSTVQRIHLYYTCRVDQIVTGTIFHYCGLVGLIISVARVTTVYI